VHCTWRTEREREGGSKGRKKEREEVRDGRGRESRKRKGWGREKEEVRDGRRKRRSEKEGSERRKR
jgi:hypothetical protein